MLQQIKPNERINMDLGWRFHRGDLDTSVPTDKSNTYRLSKTENGRGPAASAWDDTGWENVDLPHDYVVLQRPEQQYNCAQGYMKYEKAWYRKHFTLSPEDENRRLALKFDGVAKHCTVWVNGRLLKRSFSGYTPFEIDITDAAIFGGADNVISLLVDPEDIEGWWYEGGGIYRHVWLIKTEMLYISDLSVCPEAVAGEEVFNRYAGTDLTSPLPSNLWSVKFEAFVRNDTYGTARFRIFSSLESRDSNGRGRIGDRVYRTDIIEMAPRTQKAITWRMTVTCPELWDVDDPKLYTAEAIIHKEEKAPEPPGSFVAAGGVSVTTAFRTLRFDPNEGFFLNGKNVKILGTCTHQCFGPLGNALPDRAHRYKIKLLKEMGSNAFRCAHNTFAEELLDACDEYGMMVMSENRWFETSEEVLGQLSTMLIRDRNHPCVIMWSAGNEEPMESKPQGKRIMAALRAHIRKFDTSRPVTLAMSGKGMVEKYASTECDIIGINYRLNTYDKAHAMFPDKPIVASECVACPGTRGHYAPTDEAAGYFTAYDVNHYSFGSSRRDTWREVDSRPFIMGMFVWAGNEHRGETVWPRLFSQSGSLDMAWFKKDAFYMNKAQWDKNPMAHILPHWNWQGREGELIDVMVYTNADEAELFLNGRSLGRKAATDYDFPAWQVPYEPGELKAAAYSNASDESSEHSKSSQSAEHFESSQSANSKADRTIVAEDRIETTGKAAALVLNLEDNKPPLEANGLDAAILTCYCIDAQGLAVPDADPTVEFSCEGPGSIWGTASDVIDHEPVYMKVRKMRAGLIRCVIRTGTESGTIMVTARAEDMSIKPAVLKIKAI
ncbi:MAG: glycoside hydrolase family 2 TIM barrel-domain containing protein [Eubacteriales bacterium]|nr:glycoside hydrolase family 2 TIM barrel-domain containing protein [Eubacteriales bacterium]